MKKLITITFLVVFLLSNCNKGSDGPVEVIPLAPSNLNATLVSAMQVNLTWTDLSTNERGFKIERKEANGVFQVIGTTGADITNFTDVLQLNSSYVYRVYAFNSTGNSLAYSNEASVNNSLPILTTNDASQILGLTATAGGNIVNNGGSNITARGIVWNTSPNPTINLSTKTVDGSGLGTFTSKLIGLKLNTTYYFRAYATNAAGTSYGNETSFTTLNVDVETGLIAFFPFNGDAKDESGNGNDGAVNGAQLTNDRFNNPNKAYNFNSNSIQVANSPSLNPPNITISLWLLNSGKNRCILAKNNPSNARFVSYMLTIDDYWVSQRGFAVSYGRGECSTTSNFTYWGPQGQIFDNLWNHLAVSIKANGEVNCYLNGDFWFSFVGAPYSPCNDPSSILKIGGPFWGDDPQYFVGKLDDIRLYNRILTAAEVKYLSKN